MYSILRTPQYLKDLESSVITSDVVAGVAKQVVDGRALPFQDRSIRALLLTHVLHHIPDVNAFLREADRTLAPGGVISMIEVAHTPFARFFFRNFHPEPYRDDVREWAFAPPAAVRDSIRVARLFMRPKASRIVSSGSSALVCRSP